MNRQLWPCGAPSLLSLQPHGSTERSQGDFLQKDLRVFSHPSPADVPLQNATGPAGCAPRCISCAAERGGCELSCTVTARLPAALAASWKPQPRPIERDSICNYCVLIISALQSSHVGCGGFSGCPRGGAVIGLLVRGAHYFGGGGGGSYFFWATQETLRRKATKPTATTSRWAPCSPP